MAKVDLARTGGKALRRGVQYAVVAAIALTTVPVPDDVGVSEQATIVFGLAAIGAVAKAIQNYHKTKKRPVRLGSSSGYVLALAALSLALAGCVTTTAPDGTTTTQIDPAALSTAWDTWERLERRRVELERERDAADAADRARLEQELRRLEPELEDAARRLGL